MKGFRDSSKMHRVKGGSSSGARGAAKIAAVMSEFKHGSLHSGSKHGPKVTSRDQAIAIALSEAKKSR